MAEVARPSQNQNERAVRRTPGWFDERLDIGALYRKYGRKAFPVHSTFFFGEMALFAFVILVLTGTYLAFIYVPSNADVTVNGETVPEAFASVQLIESIPVANLFRNVHHWAAHVMVASILLHTLRIFLSGTYRKPREINWIIGVVLLLLTLGAAFYGYGLPYDSYAVTATGIGYEIARSIPWVGDVVSELAFGGTFPTLGSLSRMFALHVFVIPLLIMGAVGVHLLVIVKQKHSQPGYARRLAEPGKVLGVPLWPYQALLALQLLLVMFGVLCLLSAFVPPHPLSAFGPPTPETPEVKPDWYLMWIYGMLRIIPPDVSFSLFGTTIDPTFIGGVLFPMVFFGFLFAVPFLDRTNRQVYGTYEYLEPLRQVPVRLAVSAATLVFLAALCLAAFYDKYDLSLTEIWAIVVAAPVVAGSAVYVIGRRFEPAHRFDTRSSDVRVAPEAPPTPLVEPLHPAPAPTRAPAPAGVSVAAPLPLPDERGKRGFMPFPTVAERGERALDNVVTSLHELGELAPLVRQTDDPDELLEILTYIESVRAGLADSNQTLIGVVRSEEELDRSRER
ncbi:MAG TPA: cytochrome bc complex cytochrome b subunit [Thermomicrobiales bacterium]|nr:cytochrome bc complex cytochrome b subunit [Thermomicrobiales bacterium]